MAKILVVDDEPDIRELVAMNLRLDDHEVVTAVDGVEAVERAQADRPDCIVLDVMMPRRDGFSVLEELKAAQGDLNTVPVVLLTARTDRLDRIRAGIEGAVVYLTKPFSVRELRATVRQVIDADEPAARRSALTSALGELARLEGAPPGEPGPRPRLTRLEPHGPRPADPQPPVIDRSVLSMRQAEVLDAVVGAANLVEAARSLGVSRSYLYATLSRCADLLGVASGPDLVRLARAGARRGAGPGRTS